MKYLVIFVFTFLVMASACKKASKTTPSAPVLTDSISPYFFRFTLAGVAYNFDAKDPQYMPFYANEAGGYQGANVNLYPSIGLRLSWPANDTVKESDLMGLIGKTLYFSDTTVHPELSFDSTVSGTTWYSQDTSNTSYFVKITNVTFLKNDTTLGYFIKTYVITGTCNALMSQASTSILSGGSFSFIISRRDL